MNTGSVCLRVAFYWIVKRKGDIKTPHLIYQWTFKRKFIFLFIQTFGLMHANPWILYEWLLYLLSMRVLDSEYRISDAVFKYNDLVIYMDTRIPNINKLFFHLSYDHKQVCCDTRILCDRSKMISQWILFQHPPFRMRI
jgi:hypothetical protein